MNQKSVSVTKSLRNRDKFLLSRGRKEFASDKYTKVNSVKELEKHLNNL
jgi:hypothetical protein